MPPKKTHPISASAFMDDLLSGLKPTLDRNTRTPTPPNASEAAAGSSLPPPNSGRRVPSPPKLSNQSQISIPSKNLPHSVKEPSSDASELNNTSADLLEGIEDWSDFELGQDGSEGSTKGVPEAVPLCQSFVKCRVEKVEGDAQWNSLKRRMERRVEVVLKSDDNQHKTLVLCDEWTELSLDQGNPLNIVSFPGSPPINFQLDPLVFSRAEPGHVLILFPSLLISATVVSNAPFCSRRSVLSTRLKISSTEIGEPIVRGNIVHEVIQNSLLPTQEEEEDQSNPALQPTPSIPDTWEITRLSEEARKACIRHLSDLFMIGKSADEGVKMVSEHLQQLPSWSKKYLINRKENGKIILNKDALLIDPRSNTQPGGDDPRIGITGVLDTEEEIWSPKYGLKGKIDVTVQAHVIEKSSSIKNHCFDLSNLQIFPLEIKTGRQPSGIEHIAQTMLYTLLLSDRYNLDITAGLLFYTSRDDLIRVRVVKDELRHLVMARNRLARFMHSEPSYSPEIALPDPTDLEDLEDLTVCDLPPDNPILPEPIDNDRACCRCFEVEGCMLYRKTVEQVDSIPPQKGIDRLRELYERKTSHLTPVHTEFFRRWEALVSHEEKELGKLKKQIWTMSADEREQTGNTLANMVIDYTFDVNDGSYDPTSMTKIHRHTYRLKRFQTIPNSTPDDDKASLLFGHMSKHDPVVISIEKKKLAIARGFILDLTPTTMTVGLDHRLEEIGPLPVGTNLAAFLTHYASTQPHGSSASLVRYRVDKDELLAGMGKIRDNLAQLFLENGHSQLRELVVDLRKPRFDSSNIETLTENNRAAHLNEEQVGVLTKVLTAKDYALVLGMPGTGKTTTIAELIKTLIGMGKTVLLTSYTHSAVDNILSKLVDSKIDMLRLGNVDKVSSALRRFTLHESDPSQTMEALEKKLMSPPLVATTSLSINHPLFTRRSFDYCIVDEASQVTLPTCLGPLRHANVFVLVGDHYQLPPLVKNQKAKTGGLETSLFKLLTEAHPDAVVSLTMQYRMNEDIMSLSNALIYEGRLRSADQRISDLGLEIPLGVVTDSFHKDDPTECRDACWISDLIQPSRKVVFANTDLLHGKESKMGNQLQNEAEAYLALQLVNALVERGVPASEIGIIAPYRQQIKLLTSLSHAHPELEILTADKSQGRDKDCIIMSMVRNNAEEEVGELLKDWRRINVCLTRAKRKLVLFGSKQTLRHSKVLNDFFEFILQRNWIYDLQPDCIALHKSLGPSFRSSLALEKIPSTTSSSTVLNQPSNTPSSSTTKRPNDHLSPSKTRTKKLNSHHLSMSATKFGVLRDVTVNILGDPSSSSSPSN
ncbi:uncharacterized protein PGTG_09547 [Puccinia graminis f. sp. tritici CRL 75-36-700-3]|uniref:DNA replication ATP-dependent helicase/nuclease DNA2 n=1 Tax=Puccinia graminis f. sp. tritici (strain CRL 75-36-700-3 / race SCCL) TaxID=418459 RepID=E3KHQ9_PUCGT|nr:uncharacterized protein PGTG_09547 [Puccinia graminis f. sp. tritici CRL 75-36-700-3]EFP83834.1 hypothetical protein PGTG_09547 [Puccinia graminis f. sp. tritici CRL 75-36-700-3]